MVDAWLKNQVLLNRASVGVLCVIPRDHLSRSDVIVNCEILVPLIKYHGLRLSINTIAGEVDRFFALGRPVGKPPIARHLVASKRRIMHVYKLPADYFRELVFMQADVKEASSAAKRGY